MSVYVLAWTPAISFKVTWTLGPNFGAKNPLDYLAFSFRIKGSWRMDALSGNRIWASADFLRPLVLLQWIPWEPKRAGEARRADSASGYKATTV